MNKTVLIKNLRTIKIKRKLTESSLKTLDFNVRMKAKIVKK